MPRDYEIYLKDILESITKIEEYTDNISLEDFLADKMREDAVIRNLMTIGEAAKNIPKDVKSKSVGIEWEEIAGLRDILIHQYFGTDIETIWDVIKKDIPELKHKVRALIKK